jgi:hypothetical protein
LKSEALLHESVFINAGKQSVELFFLWGSIEVGGVKNLQKHEQSVVYNLFLCLPVLCTRL